MSESRLSPWVVNGWTIFAHPLFLDQVETLARQVEGLKQKDPAGYLEKNATERLAAMAKLAFEVIPQDPGRVEPTRSRRGVPTPWHQRRGDATNRPDARLETTPFLRPRPDMAAPASS